MLNFANNVWTPIFGLLVIFPNLYESEAISTPLKISVVRLGEHVKLICADENEGKITDIHWERPRGNVISQGPELYLENVKDQDVGKYICKSTSAVDLALVKYNVTNIEERSKIFFEIL